MTGPIPALAPESGAFFPVTEFDLPGTMDGGQAFRWRPIEGDIGYRGVVGRSVLEIRSAKGGLLVRVAAGEPADSAVIGHYLGLDDDLGCGPGTPKTRGWDRRCPSTWDCGCSGRTRGSVSAGSFALRHLTSPESS